MAWDSANDSLLLWGGGHANYRGNEMYIWNAGSGSWGRGSVPSRLDAAGFVIDNAAPQSAHTYDNNQYLPVNNMFVTFGGATWPSGGRFETNIGGVVSRAGPWVWDPLKADASKSGGTDGSGYDSNRLGGNMWTNRWESVVRPELASHQNQTTDYRTENGKDVVYMTMDSQLSGWVTLYRYEFADIRNGGIDNVKLVGVAGPDIGGLGAGTIDAKNNLYIRTSLQGAGYPNSDFLVWDLSKISTPNANPSRSIQLLQADGTQFNITGKFGIEYDSINDQFLLWDGGDVWSTRAAFDASGNLLSTWQVTRMTATTASRPIGNYSTCVCGKWKYVDELGAFVALDEWDPIAQDASVWLYRPYEVGAVPEASTWSMMSAGLFAVGFWALRRRTSVHLH
jgi:hypothetical protein